MSGAAAAAQFLADLILVLTLGLVLGALFAVPFRLLRRPGRGRARRERPLPAEWERP